MKLDKLKSINCFITWMPVEEESGHVSKIPSLTGQPFDYAHYKEPGMLTDYATALARLESTPLLHDGGIGVCIPTGVLVLDLDKCRDPDVGTIAPAARTIMDECKSFSEISPSCNGIHVWCLANLPAGYHKKKFMRDGQSIEVLVPGSFCTFTGNAIGVCSALEDCTEYVSALYVEAGIQRTTIPNVYLPPSNDPLLHCRHSPGTCPYGLKAIEAQLIEVRTVKKAPGRRDALYTAAVSLGHIVAGSGQITRDQVYDALRPMGMLVNLTRGQCDYYITRGLERGAHKPVFRDCAPKNVKLLEGLPTKSERIF